MHGFSEKSFEWILSRVVGVMLVVACIAILVMSSCLFPVRYMLSYAGGVEMYATYKDEELAFMAFSEVCERLGPVDAMEDECRNTRPKEECEDLVRLERELRAVADQAIALRKKALDKLPWWAPAPSYYWCAERELSGTPHRHF
jgi:hypothetical protein